MLTAVNTMLCTKQTVSYAQPKQRPMHDSFLKVSFKDNHYMPIYGTVMTTPTPGDCE